MLKFSYGRLLLQVGAIVEIQISWLLLIQNQLSAYFIGCNSITLNIVIFYVLKVQYSVLIFVNLIKSINGLKKLDKSLIFIE